ncbi:MAG: hypothetical protein H6908_00225 [Hyphomicrobiales bacterium]|nr:hypothetical protein [Hyphomicrobiales bacterium]
MNDAISQPQPPQIKSLITFARALRALKDVMPEEDYEALQRIIRDHVTNADGKTLNPVLLEQLESKIKDEYQILGEFEKRAEVVRGKYFKASGVISFDEQFTKDMKKLLSASPDQQMGLLGSFAAMAVRVRETRVDMDRYLNLSKETFQHISRVTKNDHIYMDYLAAKYLTEQGLDKKKVSQAAWEELEEKHPEFDWGKYKDKWLGNHPYFGERVLLVFDFSHSEQRVLLKRMQETVVENMINTPGEPVYPKLEKLWNEFKQIRVPSDCTFTCDTPITDAMAMQFNKGDYSDIILLEAKNLRLDSMQENRDKEDCSYLAERSFQKKQFEITH